METLVENLIAIGPVAVISVIVITVTCLVFLSLSLVSTVRKYNTTQQMYMAHHNMLLMKLKVQNTIEAEEREAELEKLQAQKRLLKRRREARIAAQLRNH